MTKTDSARRTGWAAAVMQPAIAIALLAGLLLAPPARGRMLLVPASADAARALPGMALAQGALLIGAGPWPGTLIVEATAAGLPVRMLAHGILAVSAVAGGCRTGAGRTSA